jgi:nitroreductase
MTPDTLMELLRARTSVRVFEQRPVPRALLSRLLEAATRAPSPTNRQPWRFSVVTAPALRNQIVESTQAAIDEIRTLVVASENTDHLADYWDYFVGPMRSAPAFVVVQYRRFADTIANLIEGAGADRKKFSTPDSWHVELCAASAATMLLLLQAHAEGLGACWLSGCLLARPRLIELLRVKPPWQILGGVAVGWPAEHPQPTSRKPLEKVVEWFEDAP